MSAFEISHLHIHALLTAGMHNYETGYGQATGVLRWLAPSTETEGDHERGTETTRPSRPNRPDAGEKGSDNGRIRKVQREGNQNRHL